MCSCPARSGVAHERADWPAWIRRGRADARWRTCALMWTASRHGTSSSRTPRARRARGRATRSESRAAMRASAVAEADLVICAVTAAQIGEAAMSVAAHLNRDAYYFDLNSTSPAAKQAAAAWIDAAGGRFVEAAIMSPIAPHRVASPMLLGGAHAAGFLPLATQLGFTGARSFQRSWGAASAAKMCRSVVVKGLEALMLESLLTARNSASTGGARIAAVHISRGHLAHAGPLHDFTGADPRAAPRRGDARSCAHRRRGRACAAHERRLCRVAGVGGGSFRRGE